MLPAASVRWSLGARIPILTPMKDLRIEITDKGTALYLAADPDGVWAKTTRPHDLVTIDWDAQGRVIGIEAIGSAARNAISACIAALRRLPTEDPALYSALDAVTGETLSEPPPYNPDGVAEPSRAAAG